MTAIHHRRIHIPTLTSPSTKLSLLFAPDAQPPPLFQRNAPPFDIAPGRSVADDYILASHPILKGVTDIGACLYPSLTSFLPTQFAWRSHTTATTPRAQWNSQGYHSPTPQVRCFLRNTSQQIFDHILLVGRQRFSNWRPVH